VVRWSCSRQVAAPPLTYLAERPGVVQQQELLQAPVVYTCDENSSQEPVGVADKR
jgi:hypothetical protein